MREVQYMTDLEGKRVAVQASPAKVGYEFNGVVYETASEARQAEGLAAQRRYLATALEDAEDHLANIMHGLSPYHGNWDHFDKARDTARDLLSDLFPQFCGRQDRAVGFLDAIERANDVYVELHPARANPKASA